MANYKVKWLIETLSEFDPDAEVVIGCGGYHTPEHPHNIDEVKLADVELTAEDWEKVCEDCMAEYGEGEKPDCNNCPYSDTRPVVMIVEGESL